MNKKKQKNFVSLLHHDQVVYNPFVGWVSSCATHHVPHYPHRVRTSMPTPSRSKTHQDRLRAQGFRPIQIWVLDVRSPAFAKAASEQCLAIASSPQEADDIAFIDSFALGSDE